MLIVMKTQLERIVNMMNKLNNMIEELRTRAIMINMLTNLIIWVEVAPPTIMIHMINT